VTMEIEVSAKRENGLLRRTEVRFTVKHPGEKSPSRESLRDEVAKAVSGDKDTTIIDWARSQYGLAETRGYAKVYKNKEAALETERKHILVRNGLAQAEKKEKAAPKAAPAKRETKRPSSTPAKVEEKAAPAPPKEEKKTTAPPPREEKKAAAPAKKEEKPGAKK